MPAHRAPGRYRPRHALSPVTLAVLVALSALVALAASYLMKRPCTGAPDAAGVSAHFVPRQHRYLCYTDIQYLWSRPVVRDHVFPYSSGGLDAGAPTGGALEYPVLTGLFLWLTGLAAGDDGDFLLISALFLAPAGVLTVYLLARLTGRRALIVAVAPALVFYGVYNWDPLPMAAVVVAVWFAVRDRPGAAGVALGVGAAAKLYPALFVLPLAAARLAAGDRRGALRALAGTAGAFATLNLPFLLLNPTSWLATYRFQAERDSDITSNSIWYWGPFDLSRTALNRVGPVLIGLAWLVALGVGWWRSRREGEYPWLGVGAAMLCAVLLFGKVFSPQYALWLLPFFALVAVRWGWWLAYWVADAILLVGLFRWYYRLRVGGDGGLIRSIAEIGVWDRAAVVAALYVVFLLAPAGLSRPDHQSSHRDHQAGGVHRWSGTSTPTSGPPAGSSTPSARTTSRWGARMSRMIRTQ